MQKEITLDLIKSEAKQLKTKNPTLKHHEALNDISQKYGYKSYQVLKGVLEKNNNSIFVNETKEPREPHYVVEHDGKFFELEFPYASIPEEFDGNILTKDPIKFIKTHIMISNDGVFYDVEFPFVGEPDGHRYVTQPTSLGMSYILGEDRKEQIMNAGGRIVKREQNLIEDDSDPMASMRNLMNQFESEEEFEKAL